MPAAAMTPLAPEEKRRGGVTPRNKQRILPPATRLRGGSDALTGGFLLICHLPDYVSTLLG